MRSFRLVLLASVLFVAALGVGAYWFTMGSEDSTLQTSVSVADAMSSDTTGYQRATTVRDFSFPEDHGPHPGFKNEWWYVTGNVEGPAGEPFGYELTIFRFALTPPEQNTVILTSAGSDWRTNQFYMAHFAVSNGEEETFHAFERFGRGGAGIASAQAKPFHVWLEDWSMQSVEDESTFPMRLRARTPEVGVDLTLQPEKPIVLQGDRGLSQKGPGRGNASYYYSYTRLGTEGTLMTSDDTLSVTGESWMDREWSTSALGPNQVGWDWFALQLDDGRELMYYQLRNKDGSASRFSDGTLVGPDGSTQTLAPEDVTVEVLDTWTSPDGTHTYPVEWILSIPSEDIDLRIRPYFPEQELEVSVRYWEGAVRVEGSHSGRGYVELTGYGDSPASPAS
jgi:predicted secreted hydrolase